MILIQQLGEYFHAPDSVFWYYDGKIDYMTVVFKEFTFQYPGIDKKKI